MCQIKQAEARINCINKQFVTVTDIAKCFKVGKPKAKSIFQKAVDDTISDGKQLLDDDLVHFDRVLNILGIKKKDVFDDYSRLLKAQEEEKAYEYGIG